MRGLPPPTTMAASTRRGRLLAKAASLDWASQTPRAPAPDLWDGRVIQQGPPPAPQRQHQSPQRTQDRPPTGGRRPLIKTNSQGRLDVRGWGGRPSEGPLDIPTQDQASNRPSTGVLGARTVSPPVVVERMGRRKQALRKTLSDHVASSRRREELAVQDLTLEDSHDPAGVELGGNTLLTRSSASKTATHVSTSCPNLVQDLTPSGKGKVRITRSTDGRDSGDSTRRSGASSAGSERSQRKLLTVPNIFVTSFTHSSDTPTRTTTRQESLDSVTSEPEFKTPMPPGGPQSRYRHSAPELSSSPLFSYWERLRESVKPGLRKALSETPSLPSKFNDAIGWSATTTSGATQNPEKSPTRRSLLNEPRIAKVLSYLYIGNLETSYDERLTCRLGIRSVIDLSNVTPEDVPSIKRRHAPCMCGHDERHLKATLRLGLAEADGADMHVSFDQINKFIEGARRAGKKVLVVCWTGNSVSALAVMQYLMVHQGCNLHKAYSMVMRQGSDLDLSPGYQLLLQTLEKQLLPTEEQSLCFDQTSPAKHLTREAWTTDESDI